MRPRVFRDREWPEIKDTVLHELAHAKAGLAAKHGPEWQVWAKRLGAKTERYYHVSKDELVATSKYVAKCSNGCNFEYFFNRMGRKWQRGVYCCSKCGGRLNVTTL